MIRFDAATKNLHVYRYHILVHSDSTGACRKMVPPTDIIFSSLPVGLRASLQLSMTNPRCCIILWIIFGLVENPCLAHYCSASLYTAALHIAALSGWYQLMSICKCSWKQKLKGWNRDEALLKSCVHTTSKLRHCAQQMHPSMWMCIPQRCCKSSKWT